MNQKLQEMVNRKLDMLAQKQDRLIQEWAPLIEPVEEYFKNERGREMNEMEKRNLAQVLENCMLDSGLKSRSKLFETTTQDNNHSGADETREHVQQPSA